MSTIYESLKTATQASRIGVCDINPNTFFGKLVPSVSLEECGSPLEYIECLMDGYYESEFRLVAIDGYITKTTIDILDCMINTEKVEEYYVISTKSFEQALAYYIKASKEDTMYTMYQDVDTDHKIMYTITRIVGVE